MPVMLQVLELSTIEGDKIDHHLIIVPVHAVHLEGCIHGLYPMSYQMLLKRCQKKSWALLRPTPEGSDASILERSAIERGKTVSIVFAAANAAYPEGAIHGL